MDDMPVPTVPWKEYHSKTNAKYNLILAGGFVALAGSIYIVSKTTTYILYNPISILNIFLESLFLEVYHH